MELDVIFDIIQLDIDRQIYFFTYVAIIFAIAYQIKVCPAKERVKYLRYAAVFLVSLSLLLKYFDWHRNPSGPENPYYIKFNPVGTTISDGYFQVEFSELVYPINKNLKCTSKSVVLKQEDPRVESYLSMVIEAMANEELVIATRVKSECNGKSFALENLILEKKNKK